MRPEETFVGQPVRSLQTMLRVLALDDKKYLNLIPDGIYGQDTVNAVTAFQRQNNIPITGIADQTTWEAIAEQYDAAIVRVGKAEKIEILLDPNVNLVPGDSDPHVYLLQAMLAQLADDYIQIPRPTHTGTLDETTTRSLKAFQQYASLPQDGKADRITWKNLSKQYSLSAHKNANKN